jgi:hypothetical protein
MKHIILATLLGLTLSFFNTQAQTENKQGPIIKFEETSYDFGTIEENSYATHIFKFTNVGDQPLVLKNVRPACGCTASDWTKEPIMPGETGFVTAKFNSRGYGGRSFHKSVTVTTNNEKNPIQVIYFKGFVKKKENQNNTPPQSPTQSPVRINQ